MNIKDYNIPITPGCYQYFDKNKKIIYIGKAVNLRSRVFSYWRESANHTPAKQAMLKEIADIEWIETDTEIEALLLEANLIKKYQPRFNIDLRDDKRFAYIKVSLEDEIPGVFITRKIDRQGKYFGPFTSMDSLREVLKVIRKIWPYCTERTIKKKPCFYAQIGRCTGVCGGNFDVKEYREKIIKPIIQFLSGEKKSIVKKLEMRQKKLELSAGCPENENELRFLKRQILNIKHVLASANVIGVGEKYAADVVELAKILSLPKVPERIEGYDISNIFGSDAVGSMVVFANGEPDKSEYKKFKIRVSSEMGDTGMLKEVLERRLWHVSVECRMPNVECREKFNNMNIRHSEFATRKSDLWPDPDLIIIDGGKGQLNAVLGVLKKFKQDIPVIAVSKGQGLRSAAAPDKIFFPGAKKPLELPLASPALHIIKRVRDEAHRFAITFHRSLRKKSFLR